jgi:hypothetical protein
MLYQLSYTPSAGGEVASARDGRKYLPAAYAPSPQPLSRKGRGAYFTTGRPIQVPSGPVKTRWVAGR